MTIKNNMVKYGKKSTALKFYGLVQSLRTPKEGYLCLNMGRDHKRECRALLYNAK